MKATTSIDFLKYRPAYAICSAFIFLLFGGALLYKNSTRGYGFIYGVDFAGGTQVLLQFSKPVESEEVARVLEKQGYRGVVARTFSPTEILIRVAEFAYDAKGVGERIKETVTAQLKGTTVEIKSVDSVGTDAGATLWHKSLQAVALGLLLMLLYTWWRFWSLAYGIGVLTSLFHDAIVILTFFLLFDFEISSNVIAAILAVLGYSINDTIVVFARVRENIQKLRNHSITDIVNISINETLRRTVLTAFATTLVVIALLVFGGHALQTLALALLVGIVFGTYSSIAIASSTMLLLYKDKEKRLA